jgi:hypothetical protein
MSYYRPFTTEIEDPESDGDSTTSTSSGFTDTTARRLDDPRYAIIQAAGPSFNTDAQQLFYQIGQSHHNFILGSPFNTNEVYDPSTNFATPVPFLPFTPANTATKTTLFSINSSNRDMNVYPQSTYFKIKTPRVFKNVTQIQFVQMLFPNFLNSAPDASALFTDIATYVSNNSQFDFSNCYSCLGNVGGGRGFTTSLNGGSFSEAGRTNPVANAKPLVHTFTLKGKTFDAGATANEMDKQLNTTPPFNLISYTEHRQLFLRNGNANHLFNDPGKWYYSPSTGNYVRNASKTLILKDYLPHTILQSTEPTEKELFVAYFYPVLKAALLSTYDNKFLNLGTEPLHTVNQRVLAAFEGLASPYYYELCYTNLTTLKSIRRVHTFEYHPINAYTYTYSHADKSMNVTHTELHPSLHREIQNYYEGSKLQVAQRLGYTGRDVTTLKTQAAAIAPVTTDLLLQVQTALLEVGVSATTMSKDVLGNPNTPLFMQTKQALSTTDSDDALIALTLGAPPALRPPVTINRSFPASLGWTTLAQLVQDASNAAVAAPGTRAFTAPYLQQLQSLNQVSSNFPRLYNTFLNSYSTNKGYANVLTEIQTQGLALTSNYVNKKYATVFPPALLQNNNYLNGKGTGAVTFYGSKNIHYASTPDDSNGRGLGPINTDASSCCGYMAGAVQNFYGCLPSEYIITTPFYKLGYGINDILSFYSTNTLSQTTNTHNVYIQLNQEYSLNNMDVAGTENVNISNETTGEHKKVFGKILLGGLTAGQTAQTIVQIPALFSAKAPLASVDHFTFKFYLDTMVPLNKLYPFATIGTDWNAMMQIDELVGVMPNEE